MQSFETKKLFDKRSILRSSVLNDWTFSVSASPLFYRPPLTEHMPLHGKSLCKDMARASGGAKKIHPLSLGAQTEKIGMINDTWKTAKLATQFFHHFFIIT